MGRSVWLLIGSQGQCVVCVVGGFQAPNMHTQWAGVEGCGGAAQGVATLSGGASVWAAAAIVVMVHSSAPLFLTYSKGDDVGAGAGCERGHTHGVHMPQFRPLV